MSEGQAKHGWMVGPKGWLMWSALGAAAGIVCGLAMKTGGSSQVPLALTGPFVLLLAAIAIMPILKPRFWHDHYPSVSLFLGAMVAAVYLAGFGPGGMAVVHSVIEYYSFIALIGGLFVVSGSILVRVKGKPSPLVNTALLGAGAILANLVGTTGASMLLIRPFLRLNHGRIQPLHVVFFIFIVSNCGGSLTPIGDPPLYLGFLKGVPFRWTLEHLWTDWLLVCGSLLVIFYFLDRRIGPAEQPSPSREEDAEPGLKLSGTVGLVSLGLMLFCVFADPILEKFVDLHHVPVGATCQILIAAGCYLLSGPRIREVNRFNFEPVKEVGLLFAGIFLTMIPALGYLSEHGKELGLSSPSTSLEATRFYFTTGGLSAILDNAPTYLNFLQIAMTIEGHAELSKEAVRTFATDDRGLHLLHAISAAAVFFGAMTYIGNGPNFMVKAIAEGESVKMPSFFAYVGYACVFLLPILILDWYVFVH